MPRRRSPARRASPESQLLRETTRAASRLTPFACLALGVALFLLLYFILPSWMQGQLQQQQDNPYQPLLKGIFARRTHLLELVGIASLIACILLALWKQFTRRAMTTEGQHAAGLISRLLAKLLH